MKKSHLIFRLIILAFFLLLASCSLPQAGTETGIPATEAAAAGEEAPVFEPASGTVMGWWDGSNVVYVPAGDFLMGDQNATSGDNVPAHTVTLEEFWIQKVEVTNTMYSRCVETGICAAPRQEQGRQYLYADPNFANAPVVNVSWEDADHYCNWIGGRLPSEAEWEKAARGTEGDPYPWGDEDPACSLLNFGGCINPPQPVLVGSFPGGESPYEAADMDGNVSEWVNDWFDPGYYAVSPAANPTGPSDGDFRAVRGGSYRSNEFSLFTHQRFYAAPGEFRDDLGFRCILRQGVVDAPVAPLCQAAAYIPTNQERDPAEPQEAHAPILAMDVYCNVDANGGLYGTATVHFAGGGMFDTVTSPEGGIQCTMVPGSNPPIFDCIGGAIQPGYSFTASFCNNDQLPAETYEPFCPYYYVYDETTGMCKYYIDTYSCPDGSTVVPSYGCMPLAENGPCPNGYYEATYNQVPVCIPPGGPQCLPNAGCTATCPPGLTFNDQLFCCSYPEDLPPLCPPGYAYDASQQVCVSQLATLPGCTTMTRSVPICSAPPPDTSTGISCNDFTSQSTCTANGCTWTYLTDRIGTCTP